MGHALAGWSWGHEGHVLMEKWNVQRRASIFSWHPTPPHSLPHPGKGLGSSAPLYFREKQVYLENGR